MQNASQNILPGGEIRRRELPPSEVPAGVKPERPVLGEYSSPPKVGELVSARTELLEENDALRMRLGEQAAETDRLRRQMVKLEAERLRLEAEIVEVSERENRKFGQYLHDETCQSLTGLSFMATVIARRLNDHPVAQSGIEKLARELQKLGEQTRDLARTLHPVILNGGLIPALAELARRVAEKVPCEFQSPAELPVADTTALALFRITKEAAQNAIRHGRPSHITITAIAGTERVQLVIEDDGVGIASDDMLPDEGMGLQIMRYLAHSVGGEVVIENARPTGTRVRCSVPWQPPSDNRTDSVAIPRS